MTPLRISFDFGLPVKAVVGEQHHHQDGIHYLVREVYEDGDVIEIIDQIANRHGGTATSAIIYGDACGHMRHPRSRISNYDLVEMGLGDLFPVAIAAATVNPIVCHWLERTKHRRHAVMSSPPERAVAYWVAHEEIRQVAEMITKLNRSTRQ